jgi:hypothetical protein
VDIAFGRADGNGCAPITKSGVFIAADGSKLRVRANGFYTGATGIADYHYTTLSGAGRLRHVVSEGLWLVPAAATNAAAGGEFLSPY